MRPLTDLEIGDVISCPKCDSPILQCLSIPEVGKPGYAKNFAELNLASDKRISCVDCGVPDGVWMKLEPWRLHVRGKGWLAGQ